jgi:Uma2 family endonuclease
MKEIGEKIGEYLDNGVPLVWLVDPRKVICARNFARQPDNGFESRLL